MSQVYTVVAGGIPACADITLNGVVIADAIYMKLDDAQFFGNNGERLPAGVVAATLEHFNETFAKGHQWLCDNYDSTVKRTTVKTVTL